MPRNMRERVSFYSPPADRDAVGQATGDWSPEGTRWAEVLPLRGREFFAAAAVQQEMSVKIRIRRWDDVNTTWRAQWDGLYYDITSAVRVGTDMTEILMVQGVKDGR